MPMSQREVGDQTVRRLRVWLGVALISAPLAASAMPGECVVLLHGLAKSSHSMSKLQDFLQAQGYTVANVDYPSRKYPVEQLAPTAVDQGLATCRGAHAQKVHFVTHSMGGILVRYYLSHNAIPEMGRVVMLSPPNQGSEAVDRFASWPGFRLIGGPAGLELGTSPQSIPNELGPVSYPVGVIAGTRSLSPIISMTLPGRDDGKVAVDRTRVDGMTDFLALPVSHPFVTKNAEAIRQTLAFIRTGAFER